MANHNSSIFYNFYKTHKVLVENTAMYCALAYEFAIFHSIGRGYKANKSRKNVGVLIRRLFA